DYVDLYQIHRWDYRTPVEETMQALHDVVRAGKARYIGASSMFAWQFAKAQRVAERNGWTRFVSMQNHYNLLYREEEREMIPQCIDQGVAVIPWSPLARGMLAGNRGRDGERRTTRSSTDQFTDYLYSQPTDLDVVERVAGIRWEPVPPGPHSNQEDQQAEQGQWARGGGEGRRRRGERPGQAGGGRPDGGRSPPQRGPGPAGEGRRRA